MTDANVLLVVLDSVRAANAGPEHDRETTPALRRWFRRAGGVRYTGARAPAIWSYPSHVSLFTGLPAGAHRVDSDETTFDPAAAETAFDRLRAAGHGTGLFSTNPFLSDPGWNLQSSFDAVNPGLATADPGTATTVRRVLTGRSEARAVCEAVRDWVGDREGSPWGVCVNLMDPHCPYVPVRGHNRFGNWRSLLSARTRGYGTGPGEEFRRTDAEFNAMERLYDGCLHQTDAAVAWLLDRLDAAGHLVDTHVVVTADHGEGFGEPNEVDGSPVSFHWNAVNEENLHVPLYERPPGRTDYEVRGGLAALTAFPEAVLDGGGFGVERCTAEHLYGGNVTTDADIDGEYARVLCERREDGVVKYVDDPRGTAVLGAPDGESAAVRDRVAEAFAALPTADARAGAVGDDVRERLERFGYA